MKIFSRIVISLLIIIPLHLSGQDKCHKSTEGTEFWFGFMENRWYTGNNYIEITVTAREGTTFTVESGPNGNLIGDYSIGDNESIQIRIPGDPEDIEALGSETVQNRGIHLVSENPVNLYALNYDRNSADVAVIYPVESLGTEYYAMCYKPHINIHNDGYAEGKNSEFMVVATEDTTKVKIVPSVYTDQNKSPDDTIQVTLDKGQVYQVQSANDNYQGQGDLTGSYIISDKPVAFYSGALATTVPADESMCCYDHLFEQIPPVHSWGKEYFIVPLLTRQEDTYRIMASEKNTTVNIQGIGMIELESGEVYEFTLLYNQPSRVLSDKPILVAQYSQSTQTDGRNGDPFMIILSPTTQSKNDVTFVAYDTNPINNFYINIICFTSSIGNLDLDGKKISGSFTPFSGSSYSYAQIEIEDGVHRLLSTNPDRGFLAYVYGFGSFESYGYGVGFNLDLVLDIGQSINFEGDTLLLCFGGQVTLDAGPYFDTFEWNTGENSQEIAVHEEGKYWAHTTTTEGCNLFDSIYIKVEHPIIELDIQEDEGCYPYSVELIADDGFSKYQWKNQDNEILSDSTDIIVNQTGEYTITVFDPYGCSASDTMVLTVFDVPEVSITAPSLICADSLPVSVNLSAEISGADPDLWNFPGSLKWSSKTSGKLQFSENDSQATSIDVTDWGEYTLYFSVITKDSCTNTDSITLNFQQTPLSDFSFETDEKCEGYSQKLFFEGRASDDAEFYWDLDGCIFTDTIIENKQYNISVGAFVKNPPFVKLWINDRGCMSDTTMHKIAAKPIYTMEANPRRGCDSLTVDFTSELLRPDSVEFKWYFNGDTVFSKNVTRFYPSPGYYDVSLTITNPVTGCINGFTLDSMIKVFPTPIARISANPTFCCNDSLDIHYLNSIDSSFCDWNFEGAHLLDDWNDSIWVQIDSATALVSLQVNEYGCQSETDTINVKRKPHFDLMTPDTLGCQPCSVEITGIPKDEFLSFSWLHDSLPNGFGNSEMYYFTQPGLYSIGAAAFSSETQCSDTMTKVNWITIYPKPEAQFEVDYPVATIENPDITFTNLSEGELEYFWDFDDGFTSKTKHPKHSYDELGEFNSQLIVETAFSCLDTASLLIKILPFSVFTPNAFRPDSDIPENRLFMPVGVGADAERFNIKIYNRWGQLVFESDNPENKWDGKTSKGKDAPMGNYLWRADFYDIQGIEHHQDGQVLLVR